MTKSQKLGLLRGLLTSIGAAMATYGINDGQQFLPVIGFILAGVSLGWGVLWHRDPAKPGKIKWSLVRKFANAGLTACATYGWMHPDQASGILMLIANLGPVIAMYASWIDNSPEDPDDDLDDTPPFRSIAWFLVFGFFISDSPAIAGNYRVWWDAHADPSVTQFNVYRIKGATRELLASSNTTSAKVIADPGDVIAVTAYNGAESVLSEPAMVPIKPVTPPPPAAPTGLQVVEIETSSNLGDWEPVAWVPLLPDPKKQPAKFVRARIRELPALASLEGSDRSD
jgi:hypothetical protein